MGASSKYLVIYHAISAGQNGPNLGCDEEEIVMILYLVLNVAENKVSFINYLKYFTLGFLLQLNKTKMDQQCLLRVNKRP